MPGKSKENEPIKFEVSYGRRPWLPVPINTSDWQYLEEDKHRPTFFKAIVYVTLGLMLTLGMGGILVLALGNSAGQPLWYWLSMLVLLGGVMLGIYVALTPLRQFLNYRRSKQAVPGRRKDHK